MNQRQQSILQLVAEKKKISVNELADITGVSVVTVRHDLNFLEQGKFLKRVHGFAVAINSEDTETRLMTNYSQKQALAEYAASLVHDGETVFIESGSTNALLARLLGKKRNITLITVSNYIAHLLRDSECEVILLGGIYQKRSESMVGPLTRQNLQQVHFSKLFIGVDGYHPETGFTGRDMMRTDIVNAALQKCSENIVLTDSTKFGVIHPHPIGPAHYIHRVITDQQLGPDYQASLSEHQINIALV